MIEPASETIPDYLRSLNEAQRDAACYGLGAEQTADPLLIIAGADSLHASGTPFRQFNEVLAAVIEEWRSNGVPFWIFYDLRADGLATLPTVT